MTSSQLVPALVVPFVAWRIYVRVRRNIGRQPLEPRKLKARAYIFGAITVLFAAASARYPLALAALLGGVAVSIALAQVGLRLTKFERTPKGDFYTPNTIIGVTLSLLFLGRLAYRLTLVYQAAHHHTGDSPAATSSLSSPLTTALLGLTFGYFVVYFFAVANRAKHLGEIDAVLPSN